MSSALNRACSGARLHTFTLAFSDQLPLFALHPFAPPDSLPLQPCSNSPAVHRPPEGYPFMELIEGVKLALQSLWANKMRSILTLLGVVIGVASVIMVVTLTNGAKDFVTTKINTYGAGVVTISKMPQTFITIDEYLAFQKRRDITYDDYRAVLDECRLCVSVGARRNTSGTIVFGNHSSTDTDIRGWTWTMPALSNLNIELGRSFTEIEDAHSAHVAIIGYDVVDNLLGPGDPARQRDSRRRRSLHRHRRRRTPGQDARPEHGQLGRRSRSPHSSISSAPTPPWTSMPTPAAAARSSTTSWISCAPSCAPAATSRRARRHLHHRHQRHLPESARQHPQ